MMKLKLHYFGCLMQRGHSVVKTLMLGKIEGSFFTLFFHLHQEVNSSSLSSIKVTSSVYLGLLIFFPTILVSVCMLIKIFSSSDFRLAAIQAHFSLINLENA